MKKTLLLVVLLASCIAIQAYIPLVKLGHTRTDLGLRCTSTMEYMTTEYIFAEDTAISGVSYCNCGECLLREDSISKKVYIFDLDSAKEYLLYDFAAKVGDSILTFSQHHHYDSHPIVITSIDTISDLAGNQVRRLWYMAYPYDTATVASYVEGYGAIERSLIHYNGEYQLPGGFATELRCWLDGNGNKLMFNDRGSEYLGNGCEGSGIVGMDDVDMVDVAVAYMDGMVCFSHNVSQVAIIGIDGRMFYSGADEIVDKVPVRLPSGVYLVRFSVEGKVSTTLITLTSAFTSGVTSR